VVSDGLSRNGAALTFSVEEAAPLFPCSSRWLTEQLRSGRLPGRKIGRNWRLTEDDIHEALDRLRKQTEQKADARGLTTRRRSCRKTDVVARIAEQQAAIGVGGTL
jgi:excisionase family DNA binding protein